MVQIKSRINEEIIYLNLKEVDLFGWERRKNAYIIRALMDAIEEGKELPLVHVCTLDYKVYEIEKTKKKDARFHDGGHKRALAYWLAGKPMKCSVQYGVSTIHRCDLFNIKNIYFYSNWKEFQNLREGDPNYKEITIDAILPINPRRINPFPHNL